MIFKSNFPNGLEVDREETLLNRNGFNNTNTPAIRLLLNLTYEFVVVVIC